MSFPTYYSALVCRYKMISFFEHFVKFPPQSNTQQEFSEWYEQTDMKLMWLILEPIQKKNAPDMKFEEWNNFIYTRIFTVWKTYHLHSQSELCAWPNFWILLRLISSCSLVSVDDAASSLAGEEDSGVKPKAPSLLSFLLKRPRYTSINTSGSIQTVY